MMTKRKWKPVVSILLLMAGLYTLTTGLWADAWDLNRSVYHRYGGYVAAALAACHLFLNWNILLAYFRKPRPVGTTAPQRSPDEPPVRKDGGRSFLDRRAFITASLAAVGGFLAGRFWPGREMELGATTDVGELYHQWSKPGLLSWLGTAVQWGRQPPLYKEYPWAELVTLPPPEFPKALSLEEAIEKRRSIRDYSGEAMSLGELSLLLHLADGVTAHRYGIDLRAAPSAGALYPIEIYPVVHNVEGLKPGVYHYNIREHALELLKEGDFRLKMVQYGVGQGMLGTANVVLVLTAIFQRTRWKYRERTYRYVMLEAGHIGQNIYLAATAMGMGACAVGAFFDDPINRLLEVDGVKEAVIYLLTVGKI